MRLVGDSAIGSITPGDSTDPGTAVGTPQNSPGPTGFFGELKNKAKQIINGAAARDHLDRVGMQQFGCKRSDAVHVPVVNQSIAGVLPLAPCERQL